MFVSGTAPAGGVLEVPGGGPDPRQARGAGGVAAEGGNDGARRPTEAGRGRSVERGGFLPSGRSEGEPVARAGDREGGKRLIPDEDVIGFCLA